MCADLIFCGSEIACFAKEGDLDKAIAKLNELNALQAVYAFCFAIKDLEKHPDELNLLMDKIEREMNMEES